jgi:outer membrane protein OmpA-like peptidoglycan-associated protein
VWIGAGALTYNLTNEVELSGVIYGIGQGFLYSDRGRNDKFATGLGASRVAAKFRLPFAENSFDLASRIALTMPMGRNFAVHPSHPQETDQWGLELMALQSFQLGQSLRWHLNEGFRWQGLKNSAHPKDDLLLAVTSFDYNLGRNWLAYSELASAVEMDKKIQPLQDRLVFAQGVQYLTPWNFALNMGANIGLSQKRRDGTLKRAEGVQVVFGISLATRTYQPDDDHDGIPNFSDLEPGTPREWAVDSKGRTLDSDGDGIADTVDQEPHTHYGALVDKYGRAFDSDQDGIPDGIDKEPHSPVSTLVDAYGRALDSDEDGVPDGIDLEPQTPKGTLVDAQGRELPPLEIELLTKGLLRVHRIYFDVNRVIIKPESYPVLNEIGSILAKYPELQIQIGGHTDGKGSDEFNDQLSYERALAVRGYLLAHFPNLIPDRLTVVGHGKRMPLADNRTETGRTLNRRVEFKAINIDQLLTAKVQGMR